MGIRFIKEATFKRTVKVKLASADKPDQYAHGSYVATFRKPTLEELEELTSSGNRGEEESRLAPIRQCLTKFLVGAEGIGDEGGSDRDAAEQVSIATNEAEFALPTHGEFWRCVNAMAEVKKGN